MPEAVLMAVAAAIASKSAATVYDFVKSKFAGNRKAIDVLESAEGASPDSPEVQALGEQLAHAASADQTFSVQLRDMWGDRSIEQHVDEGGVANQISGSVTGKVIQARDIKGDVTF